MTMADGQVTVFAAIDHCTADCVGIHAVKRATRFEALEPIRQGVRDHFGGFGSAVASGLRLRHDHGSQYMSDDFQKELRFLGIESSPAFVRQPEGKAYASHCTSFEPSGMNDVGGRLMMSFLPCDFFGALDPGGSYRYSGLSV